jgi:hypothetical protein
MTRQIRRITPLQLGKVLGITYGLLALLIVPIFLVFAVIAGIASRGQGGAGTPLAAFLGMGIGFAIFAPVLYAVMGFLTGVVGAFAYNLVAGWVGGIEVDVD